MSNKIKVNTELQPSGSAKQLAFLKYYLSEEMDGKPNPLFGNAYKSAKKVGYSDSYSKKILASVTKHNSKNDIVRRASEDIRKPLPAALQASGFGSDYIAKLLKRLAEKNDRRIYRGKLIDTGDPDSHAAKVALENVAKLLGLYEAEKLDIVTRDRATITESILERFRRNGQGFGGVRGDR